MVTADVWKYALGVALLLFPSGLGAEQKADQTKPYGVISIMESRDEKNVETLGNAGETAATREVIAYATANARCELLIAVFSRKGRRLANGWKPQLIAFEEWQQRTVTPGSYPKPPDPQKREAIEVWILFLAPPPAGATEVVNTQGKIQALKDAVKGVMEGTAKDAAKWEDKLLRQLENFLEDDPKARRPKLEPLAKAGQIRGGPILWRDGAKEVNINPANPGLVIIPSESPEAPRSEPQ